MHPVAPALVVRQIAGIVGNTSQFHVAVGPAAKHFATFSNRSSIDFRVAVRQQSAKGVGRRTSSIGTQCTGASCSTGGSEAFRQDQFSQQLHMHVPVVPTFLKHCCRAVVKRLLRQHHQLF